MQNFQNVQSEKMNLLSHNKKSGKKKLCGQIHICTIKTTRVDKNIINPKITNQNHNQSHNHLGARHCSLTVIYKMTIIKKLKI